MLFPGSFRRLIYKNKIDSQFAAIQFASPMRIFAKHIRFDILIFFFTSSIHVIFSNIGAWKLVFFFEQNWTYFVCFFLFMLLSKMYNVYLMMFNQYQTWSLICSFKVKMASKFGVLSIFHGYNDMNSAILSLNSHLKIHTVKKLTKISKTIYKCVVYCVYMNVFHVLYQWNNTRYKIQDTSV